MSERLRLLLVEDDVIDQRAFLRLIDSEQLTYDPVLVDCVAAAKDALSAGNIDLIIADYALSDGTGFDILDAAGTVPVIIVTGVGSEELAVKVIKSGARDYLTKDIDRKYLQLLPVVVENTLKITRSERASQEAQAERLRREMLETFIRDASHDLRTPLTSLSTSIYLLERYVSTLHNHTQQIQQAQPLLRDIERIGTRLALIHADRDRLEGIIDSMIALVKIEQVSELVLIPHELNGFVNELVSSYNDVATARGQTLSFTPAQEPVYAAVSMDEFRTIFEHLLSNAINYTSEDGAIDVTLSATDSDVNIFIADNGIGIPAEEIDLIFQRFYRVNKARTMNIGGSGLGLAIVRRLIELHNGTIRVSSVEDQGSTFQVILPRCPDAPA